MSGGESAHRRAEALTAQAHMARQRAVELDREAAWWAQGADGERRVAELLDALAPDVVALHDRLVAPGRSEVNLDHVVVTHAGVFVLDTKNWQADLTVHHGMLWRHTGPPHSRSHAPQDRALATIGRYADTMATDLGVPVHPVLVLAADRHARLEPQHVAGVHVLPMGRLHGWLLRWPVVLRDEEVEELVGACEQRYPQAVEVAAEPAARLEGFRPSATASIAPGPGLPATTARTTPRPAPVASARPERRSWRRRSVGLLGALGMLGASIALVALSPTIGRWLAELYLAVATGATHR